MTKLRRQLEAIMPSWQHVHLTKVGYIFQRIHTIDELEKLIKERLQNENNKKNAHSTVVSNGENNRT